MVIAPKLVYCPPDAQATNYAGEGFGDMSRRDQYANIKLLGGLLRLDALSPEGFTAQDLAKVSSVKPETARAFLGPKGPGFAEAIKTQQRTRDSATTDGRPPKTYRLLANRRSELIERIAKLRDGLAEQRHEGGIDRTRLFDGIALLNLTIQELGNSRDNPEDWERRLKQASLELQAARADLKALQAKRSPLATEFAAELKASQDRLEAIKSSSTANNNARHAPIDLALPAAILALLETPVEDRSASATVLNLLRTVFETMTGPDRATMQVTFLTRLCPKTLGAPTGLIDKIELLIAEDGGNLSSERIRREAALLRQSIDSKALQLIARLDNDTKTRWNCSLLLSTAFQHELSNVSPDRQDRHAATPPNQEGSLFYSLAKRGVNFLTHLLDRPTASVSTGGIYA